MKIKAVLKTTPDYVIHLRNDVLDVISAVIANSCIIDLFSKLTLVSIEVSEVNVTTGVNCYSTAERLLNSIKYHYPMHLHLRDADVSLIRHTYKSRYSNDIILEFKI